MEERLATALEPAVRLFEQKMRPGDDLSVIGLNDRPHVADSFTGDLAELGRGLTGNIHAIRPVARVTGRHGLGRRAGRPRTRAGHREHRR